jgi:hypothetical protein
VTPEATRRRCRPRKRDILDVVDIAHRSAIAPASAQDAATPRGRIVAGTPLVPLTSVDPARWQALGGRAIEPNGYYLPGWEIAVSATARGRTGASALQAVDAASQLIGLMPVVPLWQAYRIPLPALVSAHPYGTLCSPPLDRDADNDAAIQLLAQARAAGARGLILRDIALDGAALQTLISALARDGVTPRVLSSYARACLDATQDGETLLREAMGAKKLKELRRQRHRLEQHGEMVFEIARTPDEVGTALETFLWLEASGWKGKRGTALIQHDGDATFIRRAARALAETGQCEIITLRAGATPLAAGIVLRQQDRAFFFKLGIDERFAKHSPGVQLTVELTRHLCADPAIRSADSTASADHPMINPIWRGRLNIGDVLLPLRRNDPGVALIHASLAAHAGALNLGRRAVHLIRS